MLPGYISSHRGGLWSGYRESNPGLRRGGAAHFRCATTTFEPSGRFELPTSVVPGQRSDQTELRRRTYREQESNLQLAGFGPAASSVGLPRRELRVQESNLRLYQDPKSRRACQQRTPDCERSAGIEPAAPVWMTGVSTEFTTTAWLHT